MQEIRMDGSSWSSSIYKVLMPFFVSRLVIVLSAWLGQTLLIWKNKPWGATTNSLWIDWCSRWDSGWYSNIVGSGYSYVEGASSSVAFFPVYPMILLGLTKLGIPFIWAGFLTSNVFFLAALLLLYKLSEKITSSKIAINTVWLICLFPMSFFFSAVYTESVFLFFCVGAYFFSIQRMWAVAVIFAIFAGGTRVIGLAMWGVLGLEWMRAHGWTVSTMFKRESWHNLLNGFKTDWKNFALINCAPAGFIAYGLFLHLKFGNFFAFLHAQQGWGRSLQSPTSIVWKHLSIIVERGHSITAENGYFPVIASIDLICLLLAVSCAVYLWRKAYESLALFVLIGILLPITSSTVSLSRYILVLFPIFLVLGIITQEEKLNKAVTITFAGLLGFFPALFACWYWVA